MAELERRDPERRKLREADPAGLADAWAMIGERWQMTVARARELPAQVVHERVDEEWSFVETLRHLVMATDCWLRRMVKGVDHPYHPWGLAGSWLGDPAAWGIDPEARPSLEEALGPRRQRRDEVRRTIDALSADELERVCVPPGSPGYPTEEHTVLECPHVVLNEEWGHHAYATRDLAA